MAATIINSLIFLCCLAAISQINQFYRSYEEKSVLMMRYVFLGTALAVGSMCNIVMSLFYDTSSAYLFYAIDRFCKTLFMAELLLITQSLIEVPKKLGSLCVSIICYSSMGLYFVDTVIGKGKLSRSAFGVYFAPESTVHRALYFIFYTLYLSAMTAVVIYKASVTIKRRDQYELKLIVAAFGFSALGFLSDFLVIISSAGYMPLCSFCSIISLVTMGELIRYHQSIQLVETDYAKELAPNRLDVVFVLDDTFRVVFMNQRAHVLGDIYHDGYLGRKISDIFSFEDEQLKELSDVKDNVPFGIGADYLMADRHVNMVIQHKFDRYNEMFSTVVIVYNMEEREQQKETDVVDDKEEENIRKMQEEAVSITRDARVLIIDEDVLFLNQLQNALIPYEVSITRANNGFEGIEKMENDVFDIVFIADNMEKKNGIQTLNEIRALEGDYYSQVPCVLTTVRNINDIFNEFMNAGFGDYLYKPIQPIQLNSVLTRWVWQRFEGEKVTSTSKLDSWAVRYKELGTLLDDAIAFYNKNKLDKFVYCINGIKKDSSLLELGDIRDISDEIMDACKFEDEDEIRSLFFKLEGNVREIISAQ